MKRRSPRVEALATGVGLTIGSAMIQAFMIQELHYRLETRLETARFRSAKTPVTPNRYGSSEVCGRHFWKSESGEGTLEEKI